MLMRKAERSVRGRTNSHSVTYSPDPATAPSPTPDAVPASVDDNSPAASTFCSSADRRRLMLVACVAGAVPPSEPVNNMHQHSSQFECAQQSAIKQQSGSKQTHVPSIQCASRGS